MRYCKDEEKFGVECSVQCAMCEDIERLKEYERKCENEKNEFAKKEKSFLNHPLYIDAQNFWNDVQRQQIIKGMEKYPEPLKPESWTFEQLIEHAMQENVDQAHYLTALREKSRAQEERIRVLEAELEEHREYYRTMSELMDNPAFKAIREICKIVSQK